MMEQRKLRVLKGKDTSNEVFGINIPKKIAMFSKEVFFNIVKSGTSIILTSGCEIRLTSEQIKNYDYADCRIQ